VMLDLLLDRAGVKKDARKVVISGPKTGRIKNERFNLSEIKAGRVFLAWAVNGKPLPEKHGYPLRVVAPDHYGDDWVKYVARIKVG
jgi:DMSO/TMAO reductase YedYZ molybdopterin-dependent catalytic subunit